MSLSIEVEGLRKSRNFLSRKKRKIPIKEKVGLTKAAVFLQGEVKDSIAGRRQEQVSVDTGRFLNSVAFQVGRNEAWVFSDVPYAQFLEDGTPKFKGRKHFKKSKQRNQTKIVGIVENSIKSL